MKNYFKIILSLFGRYDDYSETTKQHFYRWLMDSKHEDEKNEALEKLYEEAGKRGNVPNLEKSLEQWRLNSNNIPAPSQKRFSKRSSIRVWQSVAAILLIAFISLGYMFYNVEKNESDLVQQFVPTTQMKTFFLADGSQVQMNSKSILLYPKEFTGKSRNVFLIGEANFKVKPNKNKPFIVKTDGFQVTALGTEFNVSAYAEDKNICATLITGSVLVEYDDLTKRTLLQPNEQLIYNRDSRQETLNCPDMEVVTAWQRGELIFSQVSIKDIITILERKYDYKFIYNLHSLNDDRYSFVFKDKAPLSDVMDVIVDVAGNLSFKIENDKCYIIQKE